MMWIIIALSILLGIILIIWFAYIKPYNYWQKMGVKQIKPRIFLGDSWPVLLRIMDMAEWLTWIYNHHPGERYIGMYHLYTPTLMVRDPELIKQLAVKDFDHFTDHNIFAISEDIDPLWSKNLFALKGQRWRDMRSLLSASFTSSKMKVMYSLIAETSGNFVNYYLKQDKDLIEIELKDSFTRYTNDVIASTSFGIKIDSLEDPQNEFYLRGKEATNFQTLSTLLKFLAYIFCPWLLKALKINFFSKRVTNFFTSLVNETIRVREENNIVRPDMINILMEVKKGIKRTEERDVLDTGFAVVDESPEIVIPQKRQIEITNADITSQAMIFFLAGFETVATAMCLTIYELAINPDIQEKLRKEIKETLEKFEEDIKYETLLKMKYLDMVVSEGLRKWPIAAVADRLCVKPYTLEPSKPGEPTIHLKKGDTIWLPMFPIHHDPNNYPEPEKFDPERFSDENKGNIKPYTHIPFGVGPRACIGSRFALLEIKSVLFQLLNNFEIVPVEKTVIPLKLSKKSSTFTPDGGFPLGLRRLKH